MREDYLPEFLALWMGVVAIIAIARRRKATAGVGLVLTYVMNLWLIHWIAGFLYALPWYVGWGREYTLLGVEQSLYGICGFAVGSVLLTPFVMATGLAPRARGIHEPDPRLPKAYVTVGIISYILTTSSLGQLPTLTAVISAGEQLIAVGLALCCWQAARDRKFGQLAGWILITFSLPILSILQGFLGMGALATLTVLIFLSNFVPRRTVIAAALLVGYLGLSVYVTYMRDRDHIRTMAWNGGSLGRRVDQLEETASTFEWFDPWNQKHLERIDARLNQSYLAGAAVAFLERTHNFAYGETLWDAVVAVVPRAIWPDKPVTAGSANLVTRFTGMSFANGTSVGIGQVMEFYVNFGTPGVFFGFALFGIVITMIDIIAAERLAAQDLRGFVLFYLTGLSFMQAGGQLVEITASAAGALVMASLVNRYLDRLQRKRVEAKVTGVQQVVPASE